MIERCSEDGAINDNNNNKCCSVQVYQVLLTRAQTIVTRTGIVPSRRTAEASPWTASSESLLRKTGTEL